MAEIRLSPLSVSETSITSLPIAGIWNAEDLGWAGWSRAGARASVIAVDQYAEPAARSLYPRHPSGPVCHA